MVSEGVALRLLRRSNGSYAPEISRSEERSDEQARSLERSDGSIYERSEWGWFGRGVAPSAQSFSSAWSEATEQADELARKLVQSRSDQSKSFSSSKNERS